MHQFHREKTYEWIARGEIEQLNEVQEAAMQVV
jgi:hypothetical protein